MYNKSSIYALNKKEPDAIVYPSATGKPIRVTREDFGSEEEFLAFKAWSDENFRKEDNRDVVEEKHRLPIDTLSESVLAVPAVDVVMERQHDRAEQYKKASDTVVKLKDKLTETQFRRLWMYFVDGMTIDVIGEIEGISHQNVSKSINVALKKIKNSPESEKQGAKSPPKR